jgi:hypothetical protein
MMRKVLAICFIVMLVGSVAGAAATLNVDGGTIQSGGDTSLKCDTDGVRVDGWGLETDDGSVHFVRIHDIHTNCIGADMWVIITQAGSEIARGSATIPADTNSAPDNDPDTGDVGLKINLNTPVQAADITDIEIYIEGSSP